LASNSSHLKLHQWFQAAYLMCASKKGVSSELATAMVALPKAETDTALFVLHALKAIDPVNSATV
jgi:hypothetical protein